MVTEEFRTRCSNLLTQIDSLPRTSKQADDDNRNKLKENVLSLAKIDEQIDQLLDRPDQKEELKKLEMQLNKEWLSIVTVGHTYTRGARAHGGGDFGDGIRNAFVEANSLVERLKSALKDLKRGSDRRRSSLIR